MNRQIKTFSDVGIEVNTTETWNAVLSIINELLPTIGR